MPENTAAGLSRDWLALERRVAGRLLRWGLVASVVVMAAGLVVKLVGGDLSAPAVSLTRIGEAPTTGDAVMAVGIGMLVATPAVNVVALGVVWARQRDRRFALAAVAVAALLVVAMIAGEGA